MSTSWEGPSELADRAEIDRVCAAFYAAFVSGPDCRPRIDSLRHLFLPRALIVRTCGQDLAVYDVEAFITPRRELLTSGTLTEFREWELAQRTDVFGDIAQRLSSYAKSWQLDGVAVSGRGMKTLQFVRTGEGWRISAAAWDDEREGLDLPPGFVG